MVKVKESFDLEDAEVQINGNIAGGVQSISVTKEQDNKVIHEAGSKKPREIRDGQETFNGSVEQLYVDPNVVSDLVDANGNNIPFDMVVVTKNKTPPKKMTIRGMKFKGFSIELGLTDDSKISRDFDALDVRLS